MGPFLPWIVLAYLVGSIPFGLLIARARGIDIRKHGSGNIGATNIGRVLGKKVGVACFVLDFLKGFAPTLAAGLVNHIAGRFSATPEQAGGWVCVAGAAVLGHVFPVWLGFKGGKGVATGAGALLGVFPVLTLAAAGAIVVWIVSAAVSRYVSLSSCLAGVSLPVFAAAAVALNGNGADVAERMQQQWPFIAATGAMAALVLWTHRANIARLRAGTEFKIGQKRPPTAEAPGAGIGCDTPSR